MPFTDPAPPFSSPRRGLTAPSAKFFNLGKGWPGWWLGVDVRVLDNGVNILRVVDMCGYIPRIFLEKLGVWRGRALAVLLGCRFFRPRMMRRNGALVEWVLRRDIKRLHAEPWPSAWGVRAAAAWCLCGLARHLSIEK